MASRLILVPDDVLQRLLFFFRGAGGAGVLLLGIQAVFAPKGRTTGNYVLMAVFAGVALVLGVFYQYRVVHARRTTGIDRSA